MSHWMRRSWAGWIIAILHVTPVLAQENPGEPVPATGLHRETIGGIRCWPVHRVSACTRAWDC